MSDGAIRTDVIACLRKHGVDVTEVGSDRYRIAYGDKFVEVIRLYPVVSRNRLNRFQRLFGTAVASFYPPVVPPADDDAAKGPKPA